VKQGADHDGNMVFTVAKHKTAGTHGAATLAVITQEASLLASYVQLCARPQFMSAEPFVFITTTLTQMTRSNVSSALTAAFTNSGCNMRVNCTKLCKAAVSEIHKTHPDKHADLASHMCHRVATAEKHYRIIKKQTKQYCIY